MATKSKQLHIDVVDACKILNLLENIGKDTNVPSNGWVSTKEGTGVN